MKPAGVLLLSTYLIFQNNIDSHLVSGVRILMFVLRFFRNEEHMPKIMLYYRAKLIYGIK